MKNRSILAVLTAAWLSASAANAHHWDWAIDELGHAMPETPCEGCQPLIERPPSPTPTDCPETLEVTSLDDFQNRCAPFSKATTFEARSCCLQWELANDRVTGQPRDVPLRGYQLHFGDWNMDPVANDDFSCGYVRLPNDATLGPDTYEYMVAFEFWQHRGSHHFILYDLLGSFNDPNRPRGDCSAQYVCSPGDTEACASKQNQCKSFAALPTQYPADDPADEITCGAAASYMRNVPLAGSPGGFQYFPVPYPDGLGIKISKGHIFRMQHHLQKNYTPQIGEVWINLYTVAAKTNGEDSVQKEAHVMFDGTGTLFLIPPHTIGRTQGTWVAPRNIELYGLTFHSHKRNILATADLVGVDGERKELTPRRLPYSHPYCGGYETVNGEVREDDPPLHLYESTDWVHHEQCPYWREDGIPDDEPGAGLPDNDPEGAIFIRQGEGIRYECFVNNGVLPFQAMIGAGQDPPETPHDGGGGHEHSPGVPPMVLANQDVPLEPYDSFGKVVRGKFSCEEIPGVVPGFPGAGAVGYYGNRPCIPDDLKDNPASEDLRAENVGALLVGGHAKECETGSWHQFCNPNGYCSPDRLPFAGAYTGNCVPSSIGFSETEDDEMCILLGLYAFTDDDDDVVPDEESDDVVPIGTNGPLGEGGIDRLPTDVGR